MKLKTLKPQIKTLGARVRVTTDVPSWRMDKRTAAQRGYDYRWQKYRAGFLRANPLCVMCHKEGRVTVATVVDHIQPHKGDMELFWDVDNHQALCTYHHSSVKQRIEGSQQ